MLVTCACFQIYNCTPQTCPPSFTMPPACPSPSMPLKHRPQGYPMAPKACPPPPPLQDAPPKACPPPSMPLKHGPQGYPNGPQSMTFPRPPPHPNMPLQHNGRLTLMRHAQPASPTAVLNPQTTLRLHQVHLASASKLLHVEVRPCHNLHDCAT